MEVRYPSATWKGDGKSGGAYVGVPWRVVLHTTETRTLPGYSFGFTAPHLTYLPWQGRWVQHTSFLTAARALKRVTVQTNRANALQVEIVAYSDRTTAQWVGGQWVKDLTDLQLADLQTFLQWTENEFGVRQEWPNKQAFSYAQANTAGFRMSVPEWFLYNAVCGHQHVPTNLHWDPGALTWDLLFEESMTKTQARIELAAAWHEKAGVWMTAQPPETAQTRLTRLASEIAAKIRTVEEIVAFAPPKVSPGNPVEPMPAWVIDPSLPA